MTVNINKSRLQIWNQLGIPADMSPDQMMTELDADFDPRTKAFIKPKVEGVFAFNKIWDHNAKFMETILKGAVWSKHHNQPKPGWGDSLGGLARGSFHILRAMQQSHPIAFDPEQLDVLPDWEGPSEAIDYAVHCKLPFDGVFLDLELPTRTPAPAFNRFGDKYKLLGALASMEDDTLIIVPFGELLDANEEPLIAITGRDIDPSAPRTDELEDGVRLRYLPMGAVAFNLSEDQHRVDNTFDASLPLQSWDSDSLGFNYRVWDIDFRWVLEHTFKGKGKADPEFEWKGNQYSQFGPSPCRVMVIPPEFESITPAQILGLTVSLFTGAAEVLKCLYFLDTPNIELVDAPLSRQVRRRAERDGVEISKTIFVRHSQKRSVHRDDDDSDHIDFSHRFEVRGHWKYYPEGTKTADARPDLLRYVPGRGMCRKIWCPPFVKGPDDKPLVIKTRRMRDE